jgi:hypothetical protein
VIPSGAVTLEHETAKAEWLTVLGTIREPMGQYVSHFANVHGICPFDLRSRVLLHLPRYRAEELESSGVVLAEVERLAARTFERQRGYMDWARQEPIERFEKHSAFVSEAADDVATVFHESFHYIGAGREGRHFGLYFSNRRVPAALITLSEMDVEKMRAHIPADHVGRTLVLSRMFSFRWAPPNSISYLLGRVERLLRKEKRINLLLTWVNPNLEFRASSYRAANWTYGGEERISYRYLRGNYLTARQQFQSSGLSAARLEKSQVRLAPLQVWRRFLPA